MRLSGVPVDTTSTAYVGAPGGAVLGFAATTSPVCVSVAKVSSVAVAATTAAVLVGVGVSKPAPSVSVS